MTQPYIPHPYIPHTDADEQDMLAAIGAASVDELLAPVPAELRLKKPLDLPPAAGEMALVAEASALAASNVSLSDRPHFLGGGCYDHYVPVTVDALIQRGEFLTAYTPYQAECSQGTLQAIFEFQTMVSELFALDLANASMYDGASAMAEAVLMLSQAPERKLVLVPETVHPEYRQVLATYTQHLDLEIRTLPHKDGRLDPAALDAALSDQGAGVLVVQQPNVFGLLEDAAELTRRAKAAGARVVGVVTDPVLLAFLAPPGEWGADVAAGEGQPLGNHPSFGGPHLGLLAARAEFVKRMPGRIAGATVDGRGRRGFVLTFQTREQHIRREKATSNICTNQGLLATRSTIYLSLLGREGLREAGRQSVAKAHHTAGRLEALPDWSLRFHGAYAHEFALACPVPAAQVNLELAAAGLTGGVDLGRWFPGEENSLLLAFTERTTAASMDALVQALGVIGRRAAAGRPATAGASAGRGGRP